jgi:tRNA A-37 threonylcarbamoyl transferase component Bud32
MPVKVYCPNPVCGKAGSLRKDQVGKAVRCPHCHTRFTVPSATTGSSPAADPAAAAQAKAAAYPDAPRAVSDSPPFIGRFQVRARLGGGAFGTVYRAYDPQLEREVALKVSREGTLDSPQRLERFLREAKAAARLRHPHIVPVYEAGQDGSQHYIASAFIEARTLAEILDAGPLNCRRAARLVSDLAAALAYAHAQGIVHRDVKPANVLVDARDQPSLVDFGLAYQQDAAKKLTQLGTILGTPGYMAPEQAAGASGEAQPASDQYSLGVLFYELLCGRTPFSGPVEIILFNHLHQMPPAPRQHRPDVPPELERICLKALNKRPADRYATCQELVIELERWLAHESGQGEEPQRTEVSVPGRAQKSTDPFDFGSAGRTGNPSYGATPWWRQSTALILLGTALAAVLAVILMVALAAPQRRARADAVPRVPARDDRKNDGREPRGDRDDADGDGRKDGGRDNRDRPPEREPHRPIPDREPRVVAKYVSTSAPAPILLRRRKGEEEWKRVEEKNPAVSTGDGLVSLPGYRSDLRFDNGIRLKLWGDLPEISLPELSLTIPLLESVVTLHEPEDFDLDLTLDRGRIVIANTKKGKARARVRFANPKVNGGLDDWEITLDKGAEVALERWGRYRPEVPFDRNPKTREGPESELYLFVLKGQVDVRIPEEGIQEMEAPPGLGLLIWNSKQGVEPPKDIKRLPFWASQRYPPFPKDLSKPAQDYLINLRGAMERSLKELSISMSGKGNVEAALVQELESDSAPKRVLVVRCFGATNDVSNLLDGLIDKQSPDLRQAAIEDLRHWIGLGPQNDSILFDTLVKKKDCSEGEATAVMELLHSFSARQRSQPELYARLIDYLKQPNKRIRVLAHWHLIRLVPEGLKIKYDPLGDADQIDRAYEAWKLLIPDGSLPKAARKQPQKK